MKVRRFVVLCLTLAAATSVTAQSVNLTRPEVAAVKAKLAAVQQALGSPPGYVKDSEDFYLPTEVSQARGNRFWPVSASLSMTFTDQAVQESEANLEQAAQDMQARYAAALATGNANAILQATQEMTRIASASAFGLGSAPKEDISVNVSFNSSPYAAIDPDGVVFEHPGVIALRDEEVSSDTGDIDIYFDPVALKETETLSSFTLATPEDGVTDKTGIYNIVINLSGTLADIEAWANGIDIEPILKTITR